ncbi:MAG: hypothetical protein A2504_02280 [Bdellovibrionales bacterium RIFOXYD12_FULL_39_22]|nr:MAG: hypothetical protein A2385_12305 [Bdellovibrionales bacterium RIFOXYB1_FULL_39_21]OFZ41423.1 MAG: hypothetical protein A2485_01475 [Bdellovibrionales bacterium RIFOXYC12_FULL_39_17]OFZ45378.1 MAG: hypothetical protein A2404_13490 [Bdellovibrionales bacterium RIFOXYC1_FULL_39_130]OFZ74574.1 MAG: hypothetical protein A2560_12595 [Bdellovibrionales bacterium RIFOXYD1_FULL_39_84]OFZ92583.1 MAG: hypothetical protein A2504_02280 [Bdellovibrionales bacterium RIFOXYD12_FULL_39_22]HLE09678.1 hy
MNKRLLILFFSIFFFSIHAAFENFDAEFENFDAELDEPIECLASNDDIESEAQALLEQSYPNQFPDVHPLKTNLAGITKVQNKKKLEERMFVGFEGILRLPPGQQEIMPLIGLSAEVGDDNLVYICMQLEKEDPEKSLIKLVFLKGNGLDGRTFFSKIPLLGRLSGRPSMKIKPIPVWLSPLDATVNLASPITSRIPILGQLVSFVQDDFRLLRSLVFKALSPLLEEGVEEIVVTNSNVQVKTNGRLTLVPLPQIEFNNKVNNILRFNTN